MLVWESKLSFCHTSACSVLSPDPFPAFSIFFPEFSYIIKIQQQVKANYSKKKIPWYSVSTVWDIQPLLLRQNPFLYGLRALPENVCLHSTSQTSRILHNLLSLHKSWAPGLCSCLLRRFHGTHHPWMTVGYINGCLLPTEKKICMCWECRVKQSETLHFVIL